MYNLYKIFPCFISDQIRTVFVFLCFLQKKYILLGFARKGAFYEKAYVFWFVSFFVQENCRFYPRRQSLDQSSERGSAVLKNAFFPLFCTSRKVEVSDEEKDSDTQVYRGLSSPFPLASVADILRTLDVCDRSGLELVFVGFFDPLLRDFHSAFKKSVVRLITRETLKSLYSLFKRCSFDIMLSGFNPDFTTSKIKEDSSDEFAEQTSIPVECSRKDDSK